MIRGITGLVRLSYSMYPFGYNLIVALNSYYYGHINLLW